MVCNTLLSDLLPLNVFRHDMFTSSVGRKEQLIDGRIAININSIN